MPTVNCTSCIYPRQMVKAGLDARGKQRYRCPMCGTRKEPPESRTVPRGIYKPYKFNQASELFLQGVSYRKVMEAVGLSNQAALKYRRIALQDKQVLCACGRVAGHNGWCEWRISQSPARQAYYAKCAAQSAISLARVRPRLEPVLTTWPYVRSFDNNDYALLKAVNELVPRTMPEDVRADVCQELLTAVVAGEISELEIAHNVQLFTRRVYRERPTKFKEVSIDALIFSHEGGGGRTFGDTLVAKPEEELADEELHGPRWTPRYGDSLTDCTTASDLADRLKGAWEANRLT